MQIITSLVPDNRHHEILRFRRIPNHRSSQISAIFLNIPNVPISEEGESCNFTDEFICRPIPAYQPFLLLLPNSH